MSEPDQSDRSDLTDPTDTAQGAPAEEHRPPIQPMHPNQSTTYRPALTLAAVLGGGTVCFLAIRHFGSQLSAPAAANAAAVAQKAPAAAPNSLAQILLGLLVILLASRVVGIVFRVVGQPAVIGEVIAGILLGPSLLGRFAPETMAFIFPSTTTGVLSGIAQVGVLLFMFTIGVELNTDRLKERAQATLAISYSSIVTPFLLGSALALILYPRYATRDISFTSFALFIGVSMSVTAFPVLARILMDRKLQRTRMGVMAMTCAAINDVTAWCLLAAVVGVVHARMGAVALTIGLTVAYIAIVVVFVRPLMHKLAARPDLQDNISQPVMAGICVALLLSCLATETIGIHALFGAFLLGATIPHDSALAKSLIDKMEDFVVVLLLPAFFAITGLRTQIGLLGGADWLFCVLIILAATAGKYGGTLFAARMSGIGWRDSSALGMLMNTRGLMELIVLNVGLDLRVISPRMFAMLVIMAIATTLMTTPVLDRLVGDRWREDERVMR